MPYQAAAIEAVIELTSEAINHCKRFAQVGGIKYQRLGDMASR